MPFNPVLSLPDSAFKPVGPGFGLNLTTLGAIATKAPIIGGIVSNLGSVGKLVGIHIDTQSPASHIKERLALAEPLKQAAIAGNDLAWEKLWTASSRPLPVSHVDTVPQQKNPFFGWARVDSQLAAMLREVEAARGGLPKPSGYATNDIVQSTPQQILQAGLQQTTSIGGASGFTGIGNSPATHDGAQSNPGGVPSSTNYVVVGAIVLALLFLVKGRR